METPTEKTQPTQMTNPPVKSTKMVAAAPKTVRVKLLRDCTLEDQGNIHPQVTKAGSVVTVTEENAKKLCDRHYKGNFAFSGERYEEQNVQKIYKAERVRS